MQSVHAFSKPINVKVINENCNKKKITNALIRPFQTTITMNCKISKKDEGKLPGSGHGGGHVSEVVPPNSAALARLFTFSYFAK
jgi:hypothetical protein